MVGSHHQDGWDDKEAFLEGRVRLGGTDRVRSLSRRVWEASSEGREGSGGPRGGTVGVIMPSRRAWRGKQALQEGRKDLGGPSEELGRVKRP